MAQPRDVQRLRERLKEHPGPVLTLYLSVNAGIPENQGQAYLVRLKDALSDMDSPEALEDRVFEEVKRDRPPQARTLVLFAAEDGLFEYYDLQVDLPESYRYGEPNIAPLVLAVDEHEPYGAVVVDAEEVRFFVTAPLAAPGEASGGMGSGFFKEIDLNPSSPYPRGGGSTDLDPAGRKQQSNIHRFFKDAGKLTRDVAFREGVRHLILGGPKERTSEFRDSLPNEVRDRVVVEGHVPIGAPESEIVGRLEETRERAERERKLAVISEAREKGVRGIKDTLEALQEGRVYHAISVWDLDAEVRWSDQDGLAITDITREESPYTGDDTRVRPLLDVLVDLAAARGARLEFARGENRVAATPNEDARDTGEDPQDPADVLLREFDGLAGLLRY